MKRRAPTAIAAATVAFAVALLASCGDESPTASQAVSRVGVSAPLTSLSALDETVQLQATATDGDGNPIGGVSFTWRSDNSDVVTVDETGLATAVSNGSTNVRATADGVSGSLTLYVLQTASQLALRTQPAGAVLAEPLTTQPVVEVQDANGNLLTEDNITQVTAEIGTGGGMLAGAVTATALGGVITFEDLVIAGRVGPKTLVFMPSGQARTLGLAAVSSNSLELLPGAPDAVLPLSGDGQTGRVAEALEDTLAVVVTDAGGDAASGESASWSVTSGGGSIEALGASTDVDGVNKAVWTLGSDPGDYEASVTVAGKGSASFSARAIFDPETPLTLVGTALAASSEAPLAGVYVHGNYAYVGGMSVGYYSSANIGVRIVDLSNPSSPRLVGRIPLRTRGTHDDHSHGDAVATHISTGAFQGDVAIVLYGVPDEFAPDSYPQPYGIWDVTVPGIPTFLSVLNLGNASHGNESGDLGDKPYDAMAVAGNYFYALYDRQARTTPRDPFNEDTRLAVVDISDPGNPVVVGDWQDNSAVWLMGLSLNQSATRAYITGLWPPPYHFESTHGYLYILDIQNPSQPTEIGRYVFPLRSTPSSVSIARPTSDDALVVLADHSWGPIGSQNAKCGILHILDTSNPAAISKISTFAIEQSSTPACAQNPFYIATDLAIRGNLVFSTWLGGGVRAVDISDPANPVQAGLFRSGTSLSDIALLGSDLVVATTVWESGMYVLSGPNGPQP